MMTPGLVITGKLKSVCMSPMMHSSWSGTTRENVIPPISIRYTTAKE